MADKNKQCTQCGGGKIFGHKTTCPLLRRALELLAPDAVPSDKPQSESNEPEAFIDTTEFHAWANSEEPPAEKPLPREITRATGLGFYFHATFRDDGKKK
ncbi:hypothetical protein [Corallococcus sp. AB038B]|uniref:hypothetical protein n=1 Tax=Corallococcus sp. AB038B TaxID=2316718 RepID=UPI000EC776D0|nr:hypothetical protein [Corallococcus sp. AB038B]RKH92993.1 hypothetical protein D7Y04_41975 [Corallococcus sp. AB038B]